MWWLVAACAVVGVVLVGAVSADRVVLRRYLLAATGRGGAGEAVDFARACRTRPEGFELRPWRWTLRETVMVEIARAHGLEPVGPLRSSWWVREPLVLRRAGADEPAGAGVR